jgi:MYXO-CTERM domain-containing protein
MNRTIVASLVSASLVIAGGLALAQSPPRDAGAAADESFSPGPGGGEPDGGSKLPPLESTGLEDTDFGCSCRTAPAPTHSGLFVLATGLLAGAALRRRRTRKDRQER